MASACLRFFAVAAPNPSRRSCARGRWIGRQARQKVPGDGDEETAHGGLTVEHFLRLVGGGVMKGGDGLPENA